MFNKRKNAIIVIIALSLILSLSFVFADGEDASVKDWSEINTQYILKSNIIEFDDINDEFIMDSENLFLYPITEDNQYEIGQVLLDWKTKKSYKILSVERDAEQNIFCTYTKASLTEVFEDFSISEGTYKLTSENIAELTGLSANSILTTQISEVDSENGDVIRISFKKNSNDSGYSVNASPEDEDCSDIDFDGSIDLVRPRITIEYSLIKQKYDVRFSVDEVLTATINGKKSVEFIKPEEDTVFQFVIPLEIASIEFTLDMKYGASGTADIQVAVNQSVTLNVGVKGDLTFVIPTSAEGYFNYTNLVYNASGSARASANAYVQAIPKISFNILDIEIGSVEGTLGAKGRLATGAFIIDGGTDIRFRVFFDIYGFVNAKANIFGSEKVLYENKWTLVHKETAKTLSSFWQETNDGNLNIPDPVPPSINFTADGLGENSSITYIVNGSASPENIGDFHIYINDPDVVNPADKITRVQIVRVRAGQADEIIKNYYTSDFSVIKDEDIYNLMKPQSPYQTFEKVQTFKIIAYQGENAYSSRQITVEIIEDYAPYFTFMPFNIEPVLDDPYSQWGDYTEPTSVYACPYQINEIADANKIPKFLLKIVDSDGLDIDKIAKIEIIKLSEEPWQSGTLVGEYNFTGDQQKTSIKLEISTVQCMEDDINAKFVIRATNKGGKVYTSTPVRAIWNVIDTEPWIRFGITDVPSVATYEGQRLSYMGDRSYVKNANPKFHIELEGNRIINKVEIVDFNDVAIWSKDISVLNTTEFNYDVNLLPLITPFNYYRVKATTTDGIGYYSRHIKTDWMTWSMSANPLPLQVRGYPVGIENVTVYSDEAPCFKVNYVWYGTSQTEVNKINIKNSAGTIVYTLTIDGTVSQSYDVPIEGLMNGASNKSFYAEFVYKNGGGSYKTANVNITYINKLQPSITFRPFGLNPVNGAVTYTSNNLPSQIPEETRPKFHIEVSGVAVSYKDNIQRVELIDGNNNVVKSENVSNQNSSNIILDWNTLECLNASLSGTYKIIIINKDCKIFESQWIQADWNCTNTAEISFTADGQEVGSTVTIEGSVEEIAQAGTGKFNINIQETDSYELFNIIQIDVVKANGEVAKTLTVNSRSIDTQVNITECMLAGTNESFNLVVKNAAGQEFTTGDIAVNWIYNEKSIVNFYINQNPTVVQQYYLGAPDEQLEGRPTFHISVNDPDNNGNEIVTKVEIKRKRDNQVVKSYDVAEANSRSFDADVDIFQLQNYSVYECYYVTVAYSGQQNSNSREIHICWNQPSEIELTSDLQSDNGEITINSQYSPQEAEQLGISPEFYVIVNGIDSFYENIIQKIEIVNTAGEVVDSRDYNDFIYSTEEYFSIAKCLGNSTSGEFSARVTLYDGNTYIAPESLKVNWIAEHSPTIDFTVYGSGEGTTVYIPEESLPGKGSKISVRVTDPDNTDNDIISKVEILTTNGVVLKTFDVVTQNSRSVSINEEVAQYIQQDHNYFYIKVTNKGGEVYITGGIHAYFGDITGDGNEEY